MALARIDLPRTPGIGFWKLCGSGTGEGFTPRPNWSVYAILATWPDLATAQIGTETGPVFRRWRARAIESCTLYLAPTSVRGAWSGDTPFKAPTTATPSGASDSPIAVLTRATVHPRAMTRFWRHEPAISDAIGENPDVVFKIGIGEVPLLQQVTFSVWPDAASMAAFARADGPHARAVRAVRDGGWFREELYARFAILGQSGTWNGAPPLPQLKDAA